MAFQATQTVNDDAPKALGIDVVRLSVIGCDAREAAGGREALAVHEAQPSNAHGVGLNPSETLG